MTSDENPADVIEQAARVMADNRGRNWRMMLPEYRAEHLRDAHALHDAGLLADPADRDELDDLREEVAWRRERKVLDGLNRDYAAFVGSEAIAAQMQSRAERAEAEVARLRARLRDIAEGTTAHREPCRFQDERDELRAKVEELRLIANVNGDWNLKYAQLKQRADAAEAALAEANEWGDRYKATVARVRALDTGWQHGEGNAHAYCISPAALRAALDGGAS